MRKILLLLCILSITICAKAQLFGKSWKEGAYYDFTGVKHLGLVSWTPPQLSLTKGKGDKIYFKKDKKSNDAEIKSADLASFTMKINDETIDSFIVSKNEKFEKAPFLKVEIANGLKLYSWITEQHSSRMTMGGPGGITTPDGIPLLSVDRTTTGANLFGGKTTYFFGNDPENVTELNRKNFVETMSQIMANKPEAVARIKNKKLRYGDMDDLLYFYRYDMMPPAQAPDPFSGSNN